MRATRFAPLALAFAGLAGLLLPGISAPPALGAVLMIFGKATMTVAAIAVFIRWFGSEHEADRAG